MRRRIEEGPRALRELRLALGSRPFRVALALSVAVHAAAVLWARRDHPAPAAERLVRVRIVRTRPGPPPTSAVPAEAPRIEPRTLPEIGPDAGGPRPQPDPGDSRDRAGVPPASGAVTESPPVPPPPREAAAEAESSTPAAEPGPLRTAGHAPGGSRAAPAAVEDGDAPEKGATGATEQSAPPARSPTAAAASVPAAGPVPGTSRDPVPGLPAGEELLEDLRRRIDARKVYPQLAVRNGWEGRVVVELELAGDGNLAAVRLLQRSGYGVLDTATLAAVRRAAPFRPLAGPVTVPVEYRLAP